MTVAYDNQTTSIRTLTTDPWTFNHTPVGTPRAVVLAVINYTDDVDELAKLPTYGGVQMQSVIAGTDAAGEPTRTHLYFLGSGIPTGQQQVVVDFSTATADDFAIFCVTFTAAGDCTVIDSDSISGDTANPQRTMNYGGRSAMSVFALAGGSAAVGDYTLVANTSTIASNDSGQEIQRIDRQTTAGTSDFTVGYTIAATDDVSFAALSITDVIKTKTHSVDTVLSSRVTKTQNIDSLIQKTLSKSHSVQTDLHWDVQIPYNLDALIKKTDIKSHSVESLIQKTSNLINTIDSATTNIRLFNIASNNNTGVQSSIDIPITTPTAGNLMVTAISSDKNAGTYTPPNGFQIIRDYNNTSVSGAIAIKIAAGNETSLTWSQQTASTNGISAWYAEMSGVNAEDASSENGNEDVVTSRSTGTTGTTTQAHEYALAIMAADTADSVNGSRQWSNGFTELSWVAGATVGNPGLSVAGTYLYGTQTVETTFSCTDTGDQMWAALVTFKTSLSHTISQSIDSLLQQTYIASQSIDSLAQKTSTSTSEVDALLAKTSTSSHSAESLLQKTTSVSQSIDTIIQQTQVRYHNLDSLISTTSQLTYSIDAHINPVKVSHFIDTLTYTTYIKTHSIDSIISNKVNISNSIDSYIFSRKTKANSIDAFLYKTWLENTFDGGSDGVQITTANSGGANGDKFSIAVGTGKFSSVGAYSGALGANIADTGVSTPTFAWHYNLLNLRGNNFTYYARIYHKFTENTASEQLLMGAFTLNIKRLGDRLILKDYDSITLFQSQPIPLNKWIRIEVKVTVSSIDQYDGEADIKIFLTPQSVIPFERYTNNAVKNIGYAIGDSQYFVMASGYNTTDWFVDEAVLTTEGWPGPKGTPVNALDTFIDSYIANRSQISHSIDTIIQKTLRKNNRVDAFKRETRVRNSVDAYLQKRLRFTFEGGVDGQAITDYTSGATDIEDAPFWSVSGVYSSTQKWRGSLSGRTRVSPSTFNATWEYNHLNGWQQTHNVPSELWGRVYLYADVTNNFSFQFNDFGGTNTIEIDSNTNKLILRDCNQSQNAISTNTIPWAQWIRIEFYIKMSDPVYTANGEIQAKLYFDPYSSTPTETVTATNVETRQDIVYSGDDLAFYAGVSSGTQFVYIDDIALSTDGWIGSSISKISHQVDTFINKQQTSTHSVDVVIGGFTTISQDIDTRIVTLSGMVYDDTYAAHGTQSAKFWTGTDGGQSYLEWDGLSITSGTTLYSRVYLYVPNETVGNHVISFNDGETKNASVVISSGEKVWITDSVGTEATGNISVPTNQWFRLEFEASVHSSTAVITARFYSDMESLTPTETITTSTGNTGTQFTNARFGVAWGAPEEYGPAWMDDLAIDTSEIGPYTKTKTHSIDSLLYQQKSLSYYVTTELGGVSYAYHLFDIHILKTISIYHSQDALLNKTLSAQHQIDTLTSTVGQKTFAVESLLSKQQAVSTNIDSLQSKAYATYHSIDNLISKTYQSTHSVDISAKKLTEIAHQSDSLLQLTSTKVSAIDALIQTATAKTYSIESLVQQSFSYVHNIDTFLKIIVPIQHSVSTVIKLDITHIHHVDTFLIDTREVSTSIDVYTQRGGSLNQFVDTSTIASLTKYHAIEILAQKAYQRTSDIDSLVQQTRVVQSSADAILQTTTTPLVSIDGLLQKTVGISHAADALVQRSSSVNSFLNVFLQTQTQITNGLDAFIQITGLQAHSIAAWVAETKIKSVSLDAVVMLVGRPAASVEAFIVSRQAASNSVVTLLQMTGIESHETDTSTIKTLQISTYVQSFLGSANSQIHFADVTLHKTMSVAGAVDTHPVSRSSIANGLDAMVMLQSSKQHQIESDIALGHSVSELIDTLLRQTYTASNSVDTKVYARRTVPHGVDAELAQMKFEIQYLIDSYLNLRLTNSHDIDLYTLKGNTVVSSVDTILSSSKWAISSANGLLLKTAAVAQSVDGLTQKRAANSSMLQAGIVSTLATNVAMDSLVQTTSFISAALDSIISESFTASHAADSFLQKQTVKYSSINAVIENGVSSIHHIDVLVLQTRSAQHSVAAYAAIAQVTSTSLSALISKTSSISSFADSLQEKRTTIINAADTSTLKTTNISTNVDAHIEQAKSVSHGFDINLISNVNVSHSISVLAKKALITSHSVDAYASQEGTLFNRVDIYITAKVSISTLIDAVTSYKGRVLSHRIKFRIGGKIRSIEAGPSSDMVMETGFSGTMNINTEGSSSMDIDPQGWSGL